MTWMDRTSDRNFRWRRFNHILTHSSINNVIVFVFCTNRICKIIQEEKRTQEKVVYIYPLTILTVLFVCYCFFYCATDALVVCEKIERQQLLILQIDDQ